MTVRSIEADYDLRRKLGWLAVIFLLLNAPGTIDADEAVRWHTEPPEVPQVILYLFWSETCPHCTDARQFLDNRAAPWLRVESRELLRDLDNRRRFADMAASVGETPRAVPAFFYCGESMTGFDAAETTGEHLMRELRRCYTEHYGRPPAGAEDAVPTSPDTPATGTKIEIPWFGQVDTTRFSLPTLTVVMAALDAFNPCAFFVLLFLLSLLTHTRSRPRMLLIGGTFVFVSGVAYFLFMSAWLSLFAVLGHAGWLTMAAGTVAVVMGLLNIKDFTRPAPEPTLGMNASQRSAIYGRVRRLVQLEGTWSLLAGTLLLALAANSYELLCTAGFPMVYTRVLTLATPSQTEHLLYLLAYNMIYVLPLLVIVLLYVFTLGSRKLGAREGRALKLLSGLMMLGLGLVLLTSPAILGNPLIAVALMFGAVGATAVVLHFAREA